METGQIPLVANVRGKRHVDCTVRGDFRAELVGCASAWIVRKLMHAEKLDRRVIIEDVLGAVAMMYVEIDDEDAVDAVMILGPARGNGGVGEKAEAHAKIAQCMVTRWPDQGKAIVRLPPQHGIHDIEQPAGG